MSDKAPEEMESARWAGELGDKWNMYKDKFESMIQEAGTAVIDYAEFKPDEKVIDVGCGAGITSLKIAEIVKSGHVTGLDLSEALIATCKARAEEQGLTNIDFVAADAALAQLSGYDHLFSRFGIMFFDDPYVAFANMHGFLNDGGRMTFTCWGPPPENPWVFELMGIMKNHVELPPSTPNAPGPFAFADPDYLKDILVKAGFSNIDITSWTGNQFLGGKGASPEVAAEFLIDATFVGEVIEDKPDEFKALVKADIVARLSELQTEEGIPCKGTTWMVKAVK